MQTITLIEPITVNGTIYDQLNIRRPKVRDRLAVERMKKSEAEKEIVMIANLAEVDAKVIEELDLADYAKIQGIFADFLEVTPPTSD